LGLGSFLPTLKIVNQTPPQLVSTGERGMTMRKTMKRIRRMGAEDEEEEEYDGEPHSSGQTVAAGRD